MASKFVRGLSTPAVLSLSLVLAFTAGCNRDPNVRKQKYLDSGNRYEDEGKSREAIIQYSNALKVDKNWAPAHFQLAQAYLKSGSVMAGYQEMMRTIQLDPKNLKAHIAVANLYLSAGQSDRALEQAKAVLAIDPNFADAFAVEASVQAQKGKPDEAIELINHAIQLDPKKSEYHTSLALLEARTPDKAPDAKSELQKAIAADPNNEAAHLVLGGMLNHEGDGAGAVREVQAAVKAAPKNLQARLDLAQVYLHAGNKQAAVDTLHQASEDLQDTPEGAEALSTYLTATGQLPEAEKQYAALVAKYPKSFELRYAYARILAMEHKSSPTTDIVNQLDKEEPNTPEVVVLKSALLMNEGKRNDAYDVLQKGTKATPDNVPVLLAFSRVALLKGDFANAETALRDAAKIQPNNLEAQKGLAEVANLRHDNTMLAQVAEAVLAKHPQFTDAYLWRATAEANNHEYDRASSDFHEVLSRDPNNANALLELGQILLIQKKDADAMAMFQKALDADPNFIPALDRMARHYFGTGHSDQAVELIKAQQQKSPRNPLLLDELARADFAVKDFRGSHDAAVASMALNPKSIGATQLLAQSQAAVGDFDGALQTWQNWAKDHPTDGTATTMVGEVYEQKNDPKDAMTWYRKSLTLDPGQALASNNLAYLMVESGGDLDEAMKMAQDARRALPNSPETADTLAWVYYARGRYQLGRDLLEDAVKQSPNSGLIQYHLGMTYRKLGDKTNAALHLKKATTLQPDSKVAKDAAAALAMPS